MKLLTVCIPCYNSIMEMHKAINSCLLMKDEVEVLIVDRHSHDETLQVAKEYEEAYHNLKKTLECRPMTLEGCVVRISDIISYIGRDIEDAIRLGYIKEEDIPDDITKVLGSTNREIINTIVTDIIDNSYQKPYIKMSDEVYQALLRLKNFNYQFIFYKSISLEDKERYKAGMNKIYFQYLSDLEEQKRDSLIYVYFLNRKDEIYFENTSKKRMVIDFIAGMTDDFFLREVEKIEQGK